jgi:hypothetical protein
MNRERKVELVAESFLVGMLIAMWLMVSTAIDPLDLGVSFIPAFLLFLFKLVANIIALTMIVFLFTKLVINGVVRELQRQERKERIERGKRLKKRGRTHWPS